MTENRQIGIRSTADAVAILTGFCLTVALLSLIPRPLSPDVSGELWIAHHMRLGSRLYIDISEINPPLWFWLAMPVDWVAELVHAYPEHVLILALGAVATFSLVLVGRLLAGNPRRTLLLLPYAGLILLVMPIHETGQREQYALICALPYVVLAALRRQRRAVPVSLAVTIGVGSAFGLLLKHYFLAVPALLDLWLMLSLRRDWRPFRPETLAFGAAAICYAVSIAIISPSYVTLVVPQLRLAYASTDAPSLGSMIIATQYMWGGFLVLILPQVRAFRHSLAPIASANLIAALGFFAAWLIQHKGWTYQAIPTSGCLAIGFASMLVEAWPQVVRPTRLLAATALVTPLGLALIGGLAQKPTNPAIAGTLAGLRPGDVVGLIARDGIFSLLPASVDRGLRYSGRYTRFWLLDAAEANATHSRDPRIDALAFNAITQTAADYHCLPPQRIIVQNPTHGTGHSPASDTVTYLLRNRDFAAVMRHYRFWRRSGEFDAFTPISTLPPSRTPACPRGL